MESTKDESLLEDFLVVSDQKPQVYKWFTVSSLLFIFFLVIDFTYDVANLKTKDSEWQFAVPIIMLPVLGMIGHLLGKRFGWIINFLFYLALSLGFSLGFYTEINSPYSSVDSVFLWRIFVFLMLASISTTLLLSSSMRKYFRIGHLLLVILCMLSISLVVVLTYFL